jgi:sigma-B regulation protein RsbU (phosphoserine phosphatase)
MMREMSLQTDPQELVRVYGNRIRQLYPADRSVSLSRRELAPPYVRVTRYSGWKEGHNPWLEKEKLPVLTGGLMAELIYGDEPAIIDDLLPVLADDDPAYEYLQGMSSLMALPNYDQGAALNMVVLMRKEPGAFDRESLPERVWMSNLFGRATHTLVLMDELKRAYEVVDRELRVVADIQRSLLPRDLPQVPGLQLAAHYQTSRWAGGDYYDFFPLPDDQWGLLIADVSGHGTPAAVMMAITHSIAHGYPGHPTPPAELLAHVNQHLTDRYTSETGTFVTAFYGIYDAKKRSITYACAGHNPPRLKRCSTGELSSLDHVGGLPLGLFDGVAYEQASIDLTPGDEVIFYTDGITEAQNPLGELFGMDRLDQAIEHCGLSAEGLVAAILASVEQFTGGQPPTDDRTLLVAKVL